MPENALTTYLNHLKLLKNAFLGKEVFFAYFNENISRSLCSLCSSAGIRGDLFDFRQSIELNEVLTENIYTIKMKNLIFNNNDDYINVSIKFLNSPKFCSHNGILYLKTKVLIKKPYINYAKDEKEYEQLFDILFGNDQTIFRKENAIFENMGDFLKEISCEIFKLDIYNFDDNGYDFSY